MWLRVPERVGGVSVEGIQYKTEVTVGAWNYFRAADHLVPTIVATGMGFEPCDPPEGTDLPDLPKADPLRDGAIADQQREITQLRATVDQLKTDLSMKSAEASQNGMAVEGLRLRILNLEAELANVKGDYEELRQDIPVPLLKKFDEKVRAREEEATS